ncbi:hypothetical protein RB2150_16257 [Rhodobacterales bacterium HTCC2150]|nr:hypothetical protein RB2150_16257 [Rhodobacterales bacterium HTCC2150] [Rhodobacteraceae bacterium HTCC2150]
MSWTLDHLVVSAENLDEGRKFVENALGVPMQQGGKHALMGTHNMLLGLGEFYLEVIAIDPSAPAPNRPRWFDLDNFNGAPKLTHWAASCSDLKTETDAFPKDCGEITDFERGDLRWRVALSKTGRNPFDDLAPLMIEWQGATRVPPRLIDQSIRLKTFQIQSLDVAELATAMGEFKEVNYKVAGQHGLTAVFETKDGQRTLS